MKIKDLIKQLEKYNKNSEVYIYWPYNTDIEPAIHTVKIGRKAYIVAENSQWYYGPIDKKLQQKLEGEIK